MLTFSRKFAHLVICTSFALAMVLTSGAFEYANAESIRDSISGEIDFRAYYNDVSGNESLSFMTEGANVLTDLYFYYDNTSGVNDEIQWSGEIYLQGTDDPQYQIREDEIRLQNIYLTAEKRDAWKLTGGYYSERFTQYTMNSVLLGLNGYYQINDDLRLRAFGGRANRARPGNRHRRFAGGARAEYTPVDNHQFNVSYVRTEDDEDGLSGNELNGVDTYTNTVKSIDYEGEIDQWDLTLTGEWARSDFDSDPAGPSVSLDNKDARKFEARWRPLEASEFRGKYEKVDPDFNTLSGFATTDRELTRLNWNQVVTEELTFQSQYEVWEDGLEGNTEHDVSQWEINGRYTPASNGEAYWRKELSVRYESREDEGDTPGLGNDSNDADESLWDLELWNQFGNNELILAYSRDEDNSDSTVRSEWTVDYDRRFESIYLTSDYGLEIPLTYSMRTNYEEDIDEQSGDDAVNRTVRFDNSVILAEGQREEFMLSHGYLNEHSDGTDEIVTESIGVSYSRILNRELGSEMSLSYDWTDNRNKGNPDQEYKEEKIEFRLTTPF